MTGLREEIFADISTEREAQDRKWGGPEHDAEHKPEDWVAFIIRYALWPWRRGFRVAMVEVAATAVAAIESEERKQEQRKEAKAGGWRA